MHEPLDTLLTDEPVPPAGWLYAIVAPEVRRMKIGRAQDVVKRFQELQTGSPSELTLHSATLHDNVALAETQAHEVDEWLASRETDTPANAVQTLTWMHTTTRFAASTSWATTSPPRSTLRGSRGGLL